MSDIMTGVFLKSLPVDLFESLSPVSEEGHVEMNGITTENQYVLCQWYKNHNYRE